MLKGFKDFILRGNVLDLAVGIIIGGAFTAIVTGLVDGILNPLIAALFGQPDISTVGTFPINGATFSIGLVLQAVLNFLLVAAALYFCVVAPVNALQRRRKSGDEPEPKAPAEDVLLLQEIRDLLAASTGASTPNHPNGGPRV
ncbi:large conductance mechanosensitive channel protein MscL [Puerhibacterium puerhi]|uniref:large conductance mechanosensitive channel protein MscL n=1 Tax=Puerhibacterium puerhi TaxID=2692623 RepID=UPI00135C5288|nr:large conductance mechanosensitive channel protein MscL [Puerhibacterium puerhi]